MTNEDKAFQFAIINADKYMNDEDPLGALRDGFLCGAEWKDQQYRTLKEKALALSDAVENYTRQGISRSMLLHIKDDLDKTINPKTIKA